MDHVTDCSNKVTILDQGWQAGGHWTWQLSIPTCPGQEACNARIAPQNSEEDQEVAQRQGNNLNEHHRALPQYPR